jgi:hypothetical protein
MVRLQICLWIYFPEHMDDDWEFGALSRYGALLPNHASRPDWYRDIGLNEAAAAADAYACG